MKKRRVNEIAERHAEEFAGVICGTSYEFTILYQQANTFGISNGVVIAEAQKARTRLLSAIAAAVAAGIRADRRQRSKP